jgi:L-ascorbate metabolism protein UlaG (beta-lactamase superfamily)
MMGCINAAGGRIPPMFKYAGAQRKVQWLQGAPEGTVSFNINAGLFLKWLVWFIARLPGARPQLLILDGHFAHVSVAEVKQVMENDVHLFVLPAHTSHFLHPLDVAVFSPAKRCTTRRFEISRWREGVFPSRTTLHEWLAGRLKPPFHSQM